MAPITWRNVGTPNFGDSVAALGMSGRFLDRAFTGFADGLGTFDTWRTEQNDRAAIDAASRIQDPMAYRAALEAGTAMGGLPPGAVSARTALALDNRGTALIERAAAGDALTNTRTDRAAEEGARAAAAQIQAAALAGDTATVQRLTNQYGPQIAALPIDAQGRLLDRSSSLIARDVTTQGNRLQNDGQVIQNERGRWSLGRDQATEQDQQAAQAAIMRIRESGWDNEGAAQILRESNLSPRARALVVEAARAAGFTGVLPNAYNAGTPAAGAVAGASATPASRAEAANAVYGNGVYGRPPRPLVEMDIDSVIRFGRDTLIPATRGRIGAGPDRGTSAAGAFQITGETLETYGPRALGPNWRSMPFTFENQERIAEAIYNDRRNGDLTGTWAALRNRQVPGSNTPAATPGAYRNIPWSQAREQIIQAETGGAGNQRRIATGTPTEDRTRAGAEIADAAEVARGVELRRSQNRAGTILGSYWDSINDNASAAEVANRLTRAGGTSGANPQPGGVLAGMNTAEVQEEIDRLVRIGQPAGVNAATAGAIVARNITTQRASLNPFNGSRERTVDTTANDAELRRVMDATTNTNGMRGAFEADQRIGTEVTAITQAAERVQTIATEIQRLEIAVASGQTDLRPALERRHAALNQARERLTALTQNTRGRETLSPIGVRPPGARDGTARTAVAPQEGARTAIAQAVTPSTAGTVYRRGQAAAGTPPENVSRGTLQAPTEAELQARREAVAAAARRSSPTLEQWVEDNRGRQLSDRQLAQAAVRFNTPSNELRALLNAQPAN
jgi:hypothetical protein